MDKKQITNHTEDTSQSLKNTKYKKYDMVKHLQKWMKFTKEYDNGHVDELQEIVVDGVVYTGYFSRIPEVVSDNEKCVMEMTFYYNDAVPKE